MYDAPMTNPLIPLLAAFLGFATGMLIDSHSYPVVAICTLVGAVVYTFLICLTISKLDKR